MDNIERIEFPFKLIEHFNVSLNLSSRKIAFWNKYQIFLYEEFNYKNPDHVFVINFTDSSIAHLYLSSNYITCLDHEGVVFVTRLKFKHSARKRVKNSFEQKDKDVFVIDYDEDVVYSVKKECDKLYLCINKVDTDYELYKKFTVKHQDHFTMPNEINSNKYLFCAHMLSKKEIEYVKMIFKENENEGNKQVLVLVSFDALSLYAMLVDEESPNSELSVIEIFRSPSQMSSINFITDDCIKVVVSLTVGTVIKLTLNNSSPPHIVHLNTAIYKLLAINRTLIYTDGITMWKADNVFSDSEVLFNQFNITYVKDFIKSGDELICTTYSKLIFIVPIDHNASFINPVSESEYCAAAKVLDNSDYFDKVMQEIENSNTINQKLKKEDNYLISLALANRYDIMDKIIQYNVFVYENYESVPKAGETLLLTHNMYQYFGMHVFSFLIYITTRALQPKFNGILANLFGDIKVHVSFSSNGKILDTVSIKVTEQLRDLKLLVPLNATGVQSDVNLNIKIVLNIPGALNETKTLWVAIHQKKIVLGLEQFLKLDDLNIEILKEPGECIKNLIYQTAKDQHGNLFNINLIDKDKIEWPFYVKLPKNYKELFSSKQLYSKCLDSERIEHFLKELSKDIASLNNQVQLNVLDEEFELTIIEDGFSEPLMMIMSTNCMMAFCFRNFFANVMHNFDRRVTVSVSFDEVVDSLLRNMDNYLGENSVEEFISLFGYYQRNVIGALMV